MKQVFSSLNLVDVTQLKHILEGEGIPCVIKNEILAGLAPEIPFTETFPELWVRDDTDLPKARSIKSDWQNPAQNQGAGWVCSTCHEHLEPQFSTCWKCGTARSSVTMAG